MSDKLSAVIALGFFDGVHKGHEKVIEGAVAYAKQNNALPVAFTFWGNLKGVFKKGETTLFSVEERERALKEKGVIEIIYAPVSDEFLSMDRRAFLDFLCDRYTVIGYSAGEDYRFGKGGLGDIGYLEEYAKERGQKVIIASKVEVDGERVSTTKIKEYLSAGEIEKANAMLGRAYSYSGTVRHDRSVGSKLGYPTVNFSDVNIPLKQGVYAGEVKIDGMTYGAIINYGKRPTFDLDEVRLEAHVIDFNGDLYGKTVTVEFKKYLRDVKKFDSADQLKEQLKKDLESVKI